MKGRIPQDFINDLLERIDIAEVVGARLTLKKAGREYKGLCPFHGEKTPSFHVVPEKGFYHCFGCGAHGTALTFLLEHDRLPFVDAVQQLAELAGVEVPQAAAPAPEDDRRSRLLDVVDRADRWFREQLRTHEARQRAVDYLRGRGVDGATAQRFGMGFAPPGRDGLLAALGTDESRRRLMLEAGLIGQADDGSHYDRFRNRIMFPIRDVRGRTLGFGARMLGEGQPKYLNSPETPLFHKGRELYGLWECRRALRDPERILLVEGYMDVVGLAQAGIAEACASLGTAATSDQLQKLFRLAPEVVLCFDGDAAGLRAAWKAANTALEQLQDGRTVRLLFLPQGEDPDSLVRQIGADAFRARIQEAQPLSEYLFGELAADLNLETLDDRARLAFLARPLLERIPGVMVKAMLVQRLSELTRMPAVELERMLADARAGAPTRNGGAGAQSALERSSEPFLEAASEPMPATHEGAARSTSSRVRLTREDTAVALLLQRPDLAVEVSAESLERLQRSDRSAVRLLVTLLERLRRDPELPTAVLLGAFVGRPEHGHLCRLAQGRGLPLGRLASGDSAARQLLEIIALLVRETDTERRSILMARIRERQATDDEIREYETLKRLAAGVPPH